LTCLTVGSAKSFSEIKQGNRPKSALQKDLAFYPTRHGSRVDHKALLLNAFNVEKITLVIALIV